MFRVAAALEAAARELSSSADQAGAGEPGEWEIVVGLEVHCELQTATKLFCGCANAFGAEPNTNVCPVCLGLPGSLPVLNERAVELAMRIGTALHCDVRPSTFHRKNYFYPDMPKDYQISQYDEPINVDGWLELPDGIAGRHRPGPHRRGHRQDHPHRRRRADPRGRHSLVDYNRAGVPLVEIVSASPTCARPTRPGPTPTELRPILVATGASDGRMEEGSLRVDANVSVRPRRAPRFGTRCEIKNLNSLRSLARAVDYEAARQVALSRRASAVVQETRHWDEEAGQHLSMRSKEEAYDYRYFPEPDLVPLGPGRAWQARGASRPSAPLPADRGRAWRRLLGTAPSAGRSSTRSHGRGRPAVSTTSSSRRRRRRRRPRLALARAANEVGGRRRRRGRRARSRRPSPPCWPWSRAGQLSATQAKAVLAELLEPGAATRRPSPRARLRGARRRLAGAGGRRGHRRPTRRSGRATSAAETTKKLAGFFTGQVMKATGGRPTARRWRPSSRPRADAELSPTTRQRRRRSATTGPGTVAVGGRMADHVERPLPT